MNEVKPKEAAAPGQVKKAVFNPLACCRGLIVDSRNQLNLKLFNVLLFACVAVLLARLALIIDGSYKKIQAIDLRVGGDASGESRERTVLKKLEHYLERVNQRDIFRMGATDRPENAIEAGPSSKAVEATQNLRLVGISWSADPDAMVEDIKSLKTFFVKKGQVIGDVKVEAITKDRVILRYGQEQIELR